MDEGWMESVRTRDGVDGRHENAGGVSKSAGARDVVFKSAGVRDVVFKRWGCSRGVGSGGLGCGVMECSPR